METLRPQYARLNEGIVFLHVTKDGTIDASLTKYPLADAKLFIN